jgi:hypothetical protein
VGTAVASGIRTGTSIEELLAPVVSSLNAAGYAPDVPRLAREPAVELVRLADLASIRELDDMVGPLFNDEERQRILRSSSAAWRRELMLLGVIARVGPSDSRAAIRASAAAVDKLLPANPNRPSDLLPALDELFLDHLIASALSGFMIDSFVTAVPDRQTLLNLAKGCGMAVGHVDAVIRALEAPRREAARRTRDRILTLKEGQLTLQSPPGLQPLPPKPPGGPAGPKGVARIKVGEHVDRRKRHLGDEAEAWALAAVVRPFLDMSHKERRAAIDDLLALLDNFKGAPVEAVRARAEPACAQELDEEELIDELSALLHVSPHSDDFGFDLLGWLPSSATAGPNAMCLEVKSSRDGTVHLSTGEWSLATRFNEKRIGDRYAVLIVRRAAVSGPPESFDLLVDPVALAENGLLRKTDDGYKLTYRTRMTNAFVMTGESDLNGGGHGAAS